MVNSPDAAPAIVGEYVTLTEHDEPAGKVEPQVVVTLNSGVVLRVSPVTAPLLVFCSVAVNAVLLPTG